MRLLDKQEHAIYYLKDEVTKEIIYGGAAGGGKSALGCLWVIEQCQMFPGSRWLIGRSKLKTLKETTLNSFFELSSKLKIIDQFNYNQQAGLINFNNGSQIILKDLFLYPSDPEFDTLGSLEITGAFIDEVSQVVKKAFQVVRSRCRYKLKDFAPNGELTKNLEVTQIDQEGNPIEWRMSNGKLTKGLIPKVLGTCNPSKNWVYKDFYRPFRDNELNSNRAFIQALPSDNPHLPKSYLDSLLNMDQVSVQRLYYGNWEYDDDPAKLIEYDKIINLWTNEHVIEGEKYITADIARYGSDKGVIIVWLGFQAVEIKILGISSIPDTASEIGKLANKYGIPKSNIVCDEDGVGGGVVDILKCKGFINNSKPVKEEGKTVEYRNLKSQCYFHLAEMVNKGELWIRFNNEQEKIIEELEQVKRHNVDKDGKLEVLPKDMVKELIARSPDFADALMMRMYFKFKRKSFIVSNGKLIEC